MSKKSIFAGFPLTQQTPLAPTAGPDQRLFAPSPPPPAEQQVQQARPAPGPEPPAEAKEPPKVDTYKPRKLGTKEPRNLGETHQPVSLPATGKRFDFNARPGRQANFVFTDEELEAIDDLKRDARRTHGLS